MSDKAETKLVVFKGRDIQRIPHNNEWWFSVVDVYGGLTDSPDSGAYWRKLKQRLSAEGSEVVTFCHGLNLPAPDRKMRQTDCATTEGIFRIIQSIPSPKAEPFKRCLAKVGYERVQEIEDPELATKRTKALYRAKGYSEAWIEKRMRGIAVRAELTDEWQNRGVNGEPESTKKQKGISEAGLMIQKNGKLGNMHADLGEIILYQSDDGKAALDVRLQDETVWLSQKQLSSLFETERSVITKHINNIFRTEELDVKAVCAKFAHTAADNKTYQTNYYNLDVIIAIGYRVNAKRGTQFRIWATSVLKDHLVRGYSLNQRRLAEKGVDEVRQVLRLLAGTLESHNLVSDEGRAVLEVVNRYARTWQLLLQYDEDKLPLPATKHDTKSVLEIDQARKAIATLKNDLMSRGEATDFFGNERGHGLIGLIGAVQQSFGGQDLYPSVEEKAAHLLYFVIKDHPFTDGNKRIGSFLFLLFLKANGLLEGGSFDNRALVALALLTAASESGQKELMVRLIMNLIADD
ncbi:MAG: RhuM family protein [Pseudomonadota bacterium]